MRAAAKKSENKLATRTSAKIIQLPGTAPAEVPEKRGKANKLVFSDLWAKRVRPGAKAMVYWDIKQTGLSLLVGHGGTKTFRSTYQVDGKSKTRKIGRLFENSTNQTGKDWSCEAARAVVRQDRAMAHLQTDPKLERKKAEAEAKANAFTAAEAIDRFIEEYAKITQRSWDQTELSLRRTLKAHLNRPIVEVTRDDIRAVVKAHVARGKHRMGQMSLQWVKRMYRWLAEQEIIKDDTMALLRMHFQKGHRDRVYSDAELKAIWKAAGKLDADDRDYTRLLMLLAPRKTALACLCWGHLAKDLSVWVTPAHLVKQRKSVAKPRTYITPLPKIARDILAKRKRGEDTERVFPDLLIEHTDGGRPAFYSNTLKLRLRNNGAPQHLLFHAFRHTAATRLEEAGFDLHERGLLLHHSETGTTAGYSHGKKISPKKLAVFQAWADYVAKVIE
jgi:integrase